MSNTLRPSKATWKLIRDTLDGVRNMARTLGWVVDYEITTQRTEGTTTVKDVQIEIKDGETIEEALVRTAKEQSKGVTVENVTEAAPVSQSQKSTKAKGNRASSQGGDPMAGQHPINDEIYSAIHVYQRAGETSGKVRWNANHEREMHGPNSLVFCHLHPFGDVCGSACTVKVVNE